jgi:putative spermidine/putrescine transport system ATP-binding protein
MDGGKILQYARPDEIYNKPANQFVASFIGRAAVVDGKLVRVDGENCLVQVPDLNNTTLVCQKPDDVTTGDCKVVIRTAEVKLDSGRLNDKDNVLEGLMLSREYRGGLTDHRILVGSKEIVVTSHKLCPMIHIEEGREKIYLYIDKSAMSIIAKPRPSGSPPTEL